MYSASESILINSDNIFHIISCQSSPHVNIKKNIKYEVETKVPETSSKLQKSRKTRRNKKKFISKVLQILNKACRSTQYPSIPNLAPYSQRKLPIPKPKTRNASKQEKMADISTNTDKNSKSFNKNKELIVLHNKNIEKSGNDAKYIKVINKNKELLVLRDHNANNERVELINELHKCIEEGLLRNKQKYTKNKMEPMCDEREKIVNFDIAKKTSETIKNTIISGNDSHRNIVKKDENIFRKQSEISVKTTLLHDVIITNPSPKYEHKNAEPKRERMTRKTIRRERERNIIINILSENIDDINPPRNMYETLKLIASTRRKLLNADPDDQSTKKKIQYLENNYFL